MNTKLENFTLKNMRFIALLVVVATLASHSPAAKAQGYQVGQESWGNDYRLSIYSVWRRTVNMRQAIVDARRATREMSDYTAEEIEAIERDASSKASELLAAYAACLRNSAYGSKSIAVGFVLRPTEVFCDPSRKAYLGDSGRICTITTCGHASSQSDDLGSSCNSMISRTRV